MNGITYLALAAMLMLASAPVEGIDYFQRCKALTGAKLNEMTAIFVADPGDFSATPEAVHYYANMVGKKELVDVSICPHAYTGSIMGTKVLVVTTGIGPMASVTCIQDILMQCGSLIKDIVYTGTSGWSVQQGGILNNGTKCNKGESNNNGQITRIGDVCVSPLAVNWDCRKASSSDTCKGSPDQCAYPDQHYGPDSDFLFGQCMFTNLTKSQYSFADEIIAAAKSTGQEKFPRRNAKIQKDEQEYWGLMRLQKVSDEKANYPEVASKAAPKVWTYKQCMEIDSQFFYSGAPWDMVARDYVAKTLNKAFATESYTKEKVIAVSAMEAIGLGQAMEHYAKISGRRIPFTNVRGMSNWLHQPVMFDPVNEAWFNNGEVPEDFVNGYKYGIATGSTAVLTTLQQRCLKAGILPRSACTFTVKYP